jgi:hypothetical protein
VGAVKESKGSASIVAGVPIMLFLVFTLLMLQLLVSAVRCWCLSPGRWASSAWLARCWC